MLFSKKLTISILLLVVTIIVYLNSKPIVEEDVHYHAGFIVYIDGVRQDFSDSKYMDYEMCSADSEKRKPTKAEEQIEKAHLHDGVGDVVHVEKINSKWSDLFTNIGVKFPADKKITGYIDGEKVENIMSVNIIPYSSATILIGNNDESLGNERVQVEHIREVEAKSELCGTGK